MIDRKYTESTPTAKNCPHNALDDANRYLLSERRIFTGTELALKQQYSHISGENKSND